MIKYYIPISIAFSAALLTACGDDDAAINEAISGSVSITGTARVSETLSIVSSYRDFNGLDLNEPTYQWYANGNAIVGATEATFVPTNSELNQDVHVEIDLIDDDGFAETLSSDTVNIFYPYTISMVADRVSGLGIKQSTDKGTTWGTTVVPTTDAADEHFFPSIAADGQGNLVAVSTSVNHPSFGGGTDIVVTRSSDNGASWSAIELLVAASGLDNRNDDAPQIATDKNGNWMIVWQSRDDLGGTVGGDIDIHYSVSTDNGVNWSTPAALNEWADEDTEGDEAPQIRMNGDNWVVVWHSSRDPNDATQSDDEIYSIFSSNAGATWTTPTKVTIEGVDNTTDDTYPVMDVNEETGRGILTWRGKETDAGDVDVYVSTSSNFGETWGAAKALNGDASTDSTNHQQYASSVLVEADGTVIVGWYGNTDATGTDWEVFYKVSTTNGAEWGADQILSVNADTTNNFNEISPLFLANPAGGWIAAWVNDDNGEVYVMESEDLVTWNDGGIQVVESSEENIAWVMH